MLLVLFRVLLDVCQHNIYIYILSAVLVFHVFSIRCYCRCFVLQLFSLSVLLLSSLFVTLQFCFFPAPAHSSRSSSRRYCCRCLCQFLSLYSHMWLSMLAYCLRFKGSDCHVLTPHTVCTGVHATPVHATPPADDHPICKIAFNVHKYCGSMPV